MAADRSLSRKARVESPSDSSPTPTARSPVIGVALCLAISAARSPVTATQLPSVDLVGPPCCGSILRLRLPYSAGLLYPDHDLMPTRPWDVSSSRPPFCTLAGTTLKCPLIYFFFISFFFHPLLLKRHGLTSYSHICLHLSTRKSYCYRYGFFICLVFFQCGWMLYFSKYGIRICFHVPYESGLSTLCSDIHGVRVSLPLRHRLYQLHDRRFLRLCFVAA